VPYISLTDLIVFKLNSAYQSKSPRDADDAAALLDHVIAQHQKNKTILKLAISKIAGFKPVIELSSRQTKVVEVALGNMSNCGSRKKSWWESRLRLSLSHNSLDSSTSNEGDDPAAEWQCVRLAPKEQQDTLVNGGNQGGGDSGADADADAADTADDEWSTGSWDADADADFGADSVSTVRHGTFQSSGAIPLLGDGRYEAWWRNFDSGNGNRNASGSGTGNEKASGSGSGSANDWIRSPSRLLYHVLDPHPETSAGNSHRASVGTTPISAEERESRR
jgi:hypothetical protein